MKIELKIIADIDIDQEEYPDITPEKVLDGVKVYESDVVDGFEIKHEELKCFTFVVYCFFKLGSS